MNSGFKQLFCILIFLLFLSSMGCWIVWGVYKALFFSICSISAIIVAALGNIKFEFTKKNITLCLLFYLSYCIVNYGFRFDVFFTQIPSYLFPIICIVCVSDSFKEQIIERITKWYAWIMVPSMLLFLISEVVSLPHLGIIHPPAEGYGAYANYFFLAKSLEFYDRFTGPFTEPGHMAITSVYLLVVNSFDFRKKYLWPILASVFLSFSLAGYLMVVFGYLFNLLYRGKLGLRVAIPISLFVLLFFAFGKNYNEGNNLINEKIISRLDSDEERGISGNNRVRDFVADLFFLQLTDTKTLFTGYPKDYLDQFEDQVKGAGLQIFMVKHGLLGTLAALLYSLYIYSRSQDKKYARLFLLLFLLCFLQRSYPFWFAWFICYYYGITIKDKEYENNYCLE